LNYQEITVSIEITKQCDGREMITRIQSGASILLHSTGTNSNESQWPGISSYIQV